MVLYDLPQPTTPNSFQEAPTGPTASPDEIIVFHQPLLGTIFQLKYLTPDLGWNLSWHHTSHSSAFFLPKNTAVVLAFLISQPRDFFSSHILLHDRW